jgi:hypothetical protein
MPMRETGWCAITTIFGEQVRVQALPPSAPPLVCMVDLSSGPTA